MNMKRPMLILFFISILMSREKKSEIITRREVVIWKDNSK
jgi:hypothetical protein